MATAVLWAEYFDKPHSEARMTRHPATTSRLRTIIAITALAMGQQAGAQTPATPSPADGYNVHVTAPHVVAGVTMGPYHHYCKVLSPDPVIQCMVYRTSDPNARLEQVEYIIAKSITRNSVSLGSWNRNWHDHTQEISTGRVQVHDLPPDKAKEVADLVSTTDGIIFHLWSHGESVPSGRVTIAQSVGHRNLSASEFKKGAKKKSAQ